MPRLGQPEKRPELGPGARWIEPWIVRHRRVAAIAALDDPPEQIYGAVDLVEMRKMSGIVRASNFARSISSTRGAVSR